MSRIKNRGTSAATLLVLLAAVVTPSVYTVTASAPTLAQSNASGFPLPSNVPSGTRININGSPSLNAVNQALKQQFEARYSGTQVNLSSDGSEGALQAVLSERADLAAIGRPLTDAEKAQGLVAVPLGRHKVAIIVGSNNPFNGSLSDEVVSQIYWGEISDWSAVGGAPGAIRPIDRPETSDTRQAIASYEKYRNRPFGSGGNVVRLNQDSTDELVRQLGADGIGYAIADEVLGRSDVRAVPMDDVLPSDSRYPFSQPLYYVYKGPQPSEAAQAFLGFTTDPSVLPTIATANLTGAGTPVAPPPVAVAPAAPPDALPVAPDASPDASPVPDATPTGAPPTDPASPTLESPSQPPPDATDGEAATAGSSFPWFLLLAVPVLGALLWWLFRKPDEAALVDLPGSTRLVLTPRSCRDVYAYWELSDADRALFSESGDRHLQLRLYDVTGLEDDREDPRDMQQFDCDVDMQDFHIPVAVDERDYVAEVGYLSKEQEWLTLARSAAVHVPACGPGESEPSESFGQTGVMPGLVPPTAPPAGAVVPSRVILVPRDATDAYVYWEVTEQRKEAARQKGGKVMALHLYDVTERETAGALRPVRQFKCDESIPDCHIPIPQPDRSYLVELGYVTGDRRWLKLAQSEPVRVPAPQADLLSSLDLDDLDLDDLDIDL